MKFVTLNTEQKMPIIGLGTWKSEAGKVYQAIRWAIKLGYRHFDCAQIYGNQQEIGAALRDAIKEDGIKREELFITSKIWNDAHLKDDVLPATNKILEELQLEYLDLLLMHWPVAQKKGVMMPRSDDDVISLEKAPIEDTWREMEKAQHQNLTKSIGVSNFGINRLSALIEKSEIIPAVNQVESHPFLMQNELIQWCKQNNIVVTAYSPLGSGDRSYKSDDEPNLIGNEVIKSIAQKNNISEAQVLLAWQMQRGVVVIPKSTSEEHLRDNLSAIMVSLDNRDIEDIDNIGINYRYINAKAFSFGEYTEDYIFS